MLACADLVAFVPARDLKVSRTFYEAVLGLPVVEESDFAVVFDANGTRLRVTAVENLTSAPFTVLGWRVKDIGERLAALRDAGVRAMQYDGIDQDEDGVWVAPGGTCVAWFADPDGNVLSLEQEPSL